MSPIGNTQTFPTPPARRLVLAPPQALPDESGAYGLGRFGLRSLYTRLMVVLMALVMACVGHLYVVFITTRAVSKMGLEGGFIMSLSTWMVLGSACLTAIFSLVLFARLTWPLRRLATRMRAFHDALAPTPLESPELERGDEVEILEKTFDRLTQRIRAQMSEIDRVTRLRQELVINVSHDLRTPLATLQGYLETLVLKKDNLAGTDRDTYLEVALDQSVRLGRLVGELFELTNLESGEVELDREPFSLPELIHDNVHRFLLEAAEKGVTMTVSTDDVSRPFVDADIGLIERVLENLLANAVRFTASGGEVKVGLTETDARLRVEVSDTGRGIPEDELPFVFDRYFRSRSNGDDEWTGTGLGLAIVRRILDLHESPIEVTSQPGQGTTFTFSLAIAAAK